MLLGNKRRPYYKDILLNLLEQFKSLACDILIKLRFLRSHVDCFLQNPVRTLGVLSEIKRGCLLNTMQKH